MNQFKIVDDEKHKRFRLRYTEDGKDKEILRRYQQNTKEQTHTEMLEHQKQLQEKFKTRIEETKKKTILCPTCNCPILKTSKAKHEKTQKHQKKLK